MHYPSPLVDGYIGGWDDEAQLDLELFQWLAATFLATYGLAEMCRELP